jgi:hypothetical protein
MNTAAPTIRPKKRYSGFCDKIASDLSSVIAFCTICSGGPTRAPYSPAAAMLHFSLTFHLSPGTTSPKRFEYAAAFQTKRSWTHCRAPFSESEPREVIRSGRGRRAPPISCPSADEASFMPPNATAETGGRAVASTHCLGRASFIRTRLVVSKALNARAAEAPSIGVRLKKLHRQQQLPVAARNRPLWVGGYSLQRLKFVRTELCVLVAVHRKFPSLSDSQFMRRQTQRWSKLT